MYRRLISNQKTKNPPETKPIGVRETYVRKHSDGKTPLTWAGVLHSWRRKSCELATWRAYTPGTCLSPFFGLQPSQKMALSKQNKGHFPGSRFRFQVYLGSSSPQITRQIPRLWYSVSKQGSSMVKLVGKKCLKRSSKVHNELYHEFRYLIHLGEWWMVSSFTKFSLVLKILGPLRTPELGTWFVNCEKIHGHDTILVSSDLAAAHESWEKESLYSLDFLRVCHSVICLP